MYFKAFKNHEMMQELKRKEIGFVALVKELERGERDHGFIDNYLSRTYCLTCEQSTTQTVKVDTCHQTLVEKLYGMDGLYQCPTCQQVHQISPRFIIAIPKVEASIHKLALFPENVFIDLTEDGIRILNDLIARLPKSNKEEALMLTKEPKGYQLMRQISELTIDAQTLELMGFEQQLKAAYFYLGDGQEISFKQTEEGTFRTVASDQVFSFDWTDYKVKSQPDRSEFTYPSKETSTVLNEIGLCDFLDYLNQKGSLSDVNLDKIYRYEQFRQDYPCVAILSKAGFHALIQDFILLKNPKTLYDQCAALELLTPDATTPASILGYSEEVFNRLNKGEFFTRLPYALKLKDLHRMNPISNDLLDEFDEQIPVDELGYVLERLIKLAELGYGNQESLAYVKRIDNTQALRWREGLVALMEYAEISQRLGVTPEKFPRYPEIARDLMRRNEQYVKDQGFLIACVEQAQQHQHMCYAPASEDYVITTPITSQELIREAIELEHPTKPYVDAMIENKSVILFLRRKSQPDQPYFILEWSNGQLKQVKGMNQKGLVNEPDVQAFLFRWKDYLSKQKEINHKKRVS